MDISHLFETEPNHLGVIETERLLMDIITVDLDDTLIHTSQDYSDAGEEFKKFMQDEFGVEPQRASSVRKEIDRANLAELGVSLERFPRSFREAVRKLADEPSQRQIEHAGEIGETAFKTTEEYRSRGFMEGSQELLTELESIAEEVHLLTAGVPTLQQRKIEALNLDSRLDNIHIVELDGKEEALSNLISERGVSTNKITHVGNSERSDVQPALDAGVKAVYIPQGQWLGTSGEEYEAHPDVHVFSTQDKAARSIKSRLQPTAV